MRFTLANLIALVVVAALGMGAFPVIATLLRGVPAVGLLCLVLYATLIYAAFAHENRRVYWLGFNAGAWIYLLWSSFSASFWQVLIRLEAFGVLLRGSDASQASVIVLVVVLPTLLLGHLAGRVARWYFVGRKRDMSRDKTEIATDGDC